MLHKFWREYTAKEIHDIQNKKCSKCKYGKQYYGNRLINQRYYYCDYLSMTGQRRECRPEDCEHHKEK